MSTSLTPKFTHRRQRGAASLAIAALLMFMLVAAVAVVMKVSGSAVFDSAIQEEQTAALFLAESGVERARATINAAALAGNYTDTTCTGLAAINGTAAGTLGRGTFSYTATSVPGTCGGSSPSACTSCTISSTGAITGRPTTRTIRTVITSTLTDGASGCSDNFTLVLPIPGNQPAAPGIWTHVAYRAKGISGTCSGGSSANAAVATCNVSGGGTCNLAQGWDVNRTGTNNASSYGFFGSAPTTAGTYTVSVTLEGANTPATRSYAATGVVMFPTSNAPVSYIGSYGADGKTADTSDLDGVVPNDWTCGAANATPNTMSRAAGADTLFYGLSALGIGTGNETTDLTFGIQPMYRISSLTGGNGDYLYSQSWLSYNPAYWPTATGATNGANFTGATGGVVTGEITGTSLNVTSVSGGSLYGALRVGDSITGTGVTAGTIITAFGSGTGGTGTYTVNNSQTVTSTTLTVSSNILRVTDVASGVLTPGDAISTGITGAPTVQSFAASGSTGAGLVGEYVLSAKVAPVNTSAMQSSGLTVTVPGGGTAPSVGTALHVPSGTGTFGTVLLDSGSYITDTTLFVPNSTLMPNRGDTLHGRFVMLGTRITSDAVVDMSYTKYTVTPTQTGSPGSILARTAVDSGSGIVTGSISGTTLTVTGVTSGTLRVGDGISGTDVQPNTRIMSQLTGTGGAGTYTVCKLTAGAYPWTCTSQNVPLQTITAAPSANAFFVSRQPTTRLSASAQLCGGICPFLYPFTGSGANAGTHFTITGLTAGRDWASGAACLSNVNPFNIRYLSRVVASQSSWSEPTK